MNFFDGILYMIWRGIAIGVIISAPMGPVGILCVQRTLEKGRKTGFYTGIGAAFSDLIYCLLTGFGLSFIEDFLERNQNVIQLIGSLVLIGFGIYLFKSNPSRNLRTPGDKSVSVRKNILNGFLFTFSNPLIIFLIIGLFARFNFMLPEIRFYHYIVGFASIFAGALLWWYIISYSVDKVRAHFNLRSMWLVNKIIGSVILLFALVGIITGITAMATARPIHPAPEPVYLNSSRGFSPFKNNRDGRLVIADNLCGPARDMIATSGYPFQLEFRSANLHNRSRQKYAARLSDGSTTRVSHPAWEICLASRSGPRYTIRFRTLDNATDETYARTLLSATLLKGDSTIALKSIASGFDMFTGQNAFSLSLTRGRIALAGGNREHIPIFDLPLPSGTQIDSIGFAVDPGGSVEISDFALTYLKKEGDREITEFGDHDVLETHLMRSTDPLEGIWRVFDRNFDESLLRMGGDYRFAIIKRGDVYKLIYLSGARTERDHWQPGMVKAILNPSGFEDIYNVEWTDATGETISNEVKAQYVLPLLTITFPHHSSTLRLRKESPEQAH